MIFSYSISYFSGKKQLIFQLYHVKPCYFSYILYYVIPHFWNDNPIYIEKSHQGIIQSWICSSFFAARVTGDPHFFKETTTE